MVVAITFVRIEVYTQGGPMNKNFFGLNFINVVIFTINFSSDHLNFYSHMYDSYYQFS